MGMTLVPSYGRDYKSGKEVREAWESGRDFTIQSFGHDNGRQINLEDAQRTGGVFNIRYKRLTQVKVIKVAKR